MLKNEIIVISMTRQDLDEYVEKYYHNFQGHENCEPEERLNQKQAAALFGVTTAAIIRWQKKGHYSL